jgi:hypothetical protein
MRYKRISFASKRTVIPILTKDLKSKDLPGTKERKIFLEDK